MFNWLNINQFWDHKDPCLFCYLRIKHISIKLFYSVYLLLVLVMIKYWTNGNTSFTFIDISCQSMEPLELRIHLKSDSLKRVKLKPPRLEFYNQYTHKKIYLDLDKKTVHDNQKDLPIVDRKKMIFMKHLTVNVCKCLRF